MSRYPWDNVDVFWEINERNKVSRFTGRLMATGKPKSTSNLSTFRNAGALVVWCDTPNNRHVKISRPTIRITDVRRWHRLNLFSQSCKICLPLTLQSTKHRRSISISRGGDIPYGLMADAIMKSSSQWRKPETQNILLDSVMMKLSTSPTETQNKES